MRYGPAVIGTMVGTAALAGITAAVLYATRDAGAPASAQAIPLVFQNDPANRKLLTPHFEIDYSEAPDLNVPGGKGGDEFTVPWELAPFDPSRVEAICNDVPDIAEYTALFMEMAYHEYCVVLHYPNPGSRDIDTSFISGI
ncbi:MAG: hypothetical protein HQ582_06790 [Planctomycetes bacterium]|nr:hypothetical protein [Planctomycetota bacterium]